MFNFNALAWKKYSFILVLVLVGFTVAACGADEESSKEKGEVELSLVDWDSEIASSHVAGKVLEDNGYDVKITPLDMSIMWESVTTGEVDGMLAAWLPGDMAAQYEEFGDQVEDLGPNLEGAKIGLVVPEYMEDINSIEDLDDQMDKTIVGIDPGSGLVTATEEAFEEYDNLADWEIAVSSSGAMVTTLKEAYENEEPIVVTGWSPHWKFASFDLKYLEDPKGVYGGEQHISTMVRQDLKDDMPEVYQFLDNFYWEAEDMESVMLDISEGMEPDEAAAKWVENNQDIVEEWTDGMEE